MRIISKKKKCEKNRENKHDWSVASYFRFSNTLFAIHWHRTQQVGYCLAAKCYFLFLFVSRLRRVFVSTDTTKMSQTMNTNQWLNSATPGRLACHILLLCFFFVIASIGRKEIWSTKNSLFFILLFVRWQPLMVVDHQHRRNGAHYSLKIVENAFH